MNWNHPDTQRYFIRATDKIIRLRHKNADEYRSEVIHIPKHVIEELRPELYCQRIDVLFQNTKIVNLPEYLALWVLDKFPKVYLVDGDICLTKRCLDTMVWNELVDLAKQLGVYKVGMTREQTKEAINETK